MEYQIKRVFTLLRTGMLPDDIAIQVVQQLVLSVKQRAIDPPKVNILSAIIDKYIAANQGEWIEKTKMDSHYILPASIMGAASMLSVTKKEGYGLLYLSGGIIWKLLYWMDAFKFIGYRSLGQWYHLIHPTPPKESAMCGRFTLHAPLEVLAKAFDLQELPDIEPRY